MSSFFPVARAADALLVAAASDLLCLQGDLPPRFERSTGLRMRLTFGSSGQLARQIAAGAPYDVFLSADEKRVRELETSGFLEPGSVAPYALGRLALWSRTGDIRTLKDLERPGLRHIAIANPAHAPYGAAAKEALERAGLWKTLQPKVVYAETVRQALEFAESGNAEVTLTAWSLVNDRSPAPVPETLYSPLRQWGGVVTGSRNSMTARAFLRWLLGPDGQGMLRRYGFIVPAPR